MPVYTMQCPHCKKVYDMIVSVTASEGELIKSLICPDCGHTGMLKRYTETKVMIKGLTTPGRSI